MQVNIYNLKYYNHTMVITQFKAKRANSGQHLRKLNITKVIKCKIKSQR